MSDLEQEWWLAESYRNYKKEIERHEAEIARLREALEMVRDADNDCHADGLPTIPAVARAKIDRALAATATKKKQGPLRHEWDRSGERCVRCGAKDWMGGECNATEADKAGGG